MATASARNEIVRVDIEADDSGLLFATSPNLRGLLVAKTSRDALEAALPQAIADHYAVKGRKVEVKKVGTDLSEWLVVPTNSFVDAQ